MDAKQSKSSKTSKTSKSKLSLKKKNPTKQDESDNSLNFSDQRSSSFDFLRVITGDSSLNQSDDFRETRLTSRVQGKKTGVKRSLSLNKQNKSKSSDKVSSSSNQSGSEKQKKRDDDANKSQNKHKSKTKSSDETSGKSAQHRSDRNKDDGFDEIAGKQKSKDNLNISPTASSTQSNKNGNSDSDKTSNEKKSKIQSMPKTSSKASSSKPKSDSKNDTVDDQIDIINSPVKSCTVQLSKVDIVEKTLAVRNSEIDNESKPTREGSSIDKDVGGAAGETCEETIGSSAIDNDAGDEVGEKSNRRTGASSDAGVKKSKQRKGSSSIDNDAGDEDGEKNNRRTGASSDAGVKKSKQRKGSSSIDNDAGDEDGEKNNRRTGASSDAGVKKSKQRKGSSSIDNDAGDEDGEKNNRRTGASSDAGVKKSKQRKGSSSIDNDAGNKDGEKSNRRTGASLVDNGASDAVGKKDKQRKGLSSINNNAGDEDGEKSKRRAEASSIDNGASDAGGKKSKQRKGSSSIDNDAGNKDGEKSNHRTGASSVDNGASGVGGKKNKSRKGSSSIDNDTGVGSENGKARTEVVDNDACDAVAGKSKARTDTSSFDNNAGDEEVEKRNCPICGKVLGNIQGSVDLDFHISQCLKNRFSALGKTREDEHLAHQIQAREQEKDMEEKLTEDAFYPCQICHKDISKMNSRRRQQHVNRCIDVVEKDKKEQKAKDKQKAKIKILDCPMCGLPLNTKLQRESHLKKCAKDLNVPSAQLIELVRNQEEIAVRESANQPASESEELRGTAEVPPAAPKAKGRPKKRKKKPGEEIDEDTQLAMAMSASLAPDQAQLGRENDAPVKKGKGRKKKNAEKEVPVLLVRSDAERQRLLEIKLANMVAPQEVVDFEKTPSLRQSKVATRKFKHSKSPLRKGKPLWELSAQNNPGKGSQTPFYVSQLKDNITVPVLSETPKRKARILKNQHDGDGGCSTDIIDSTQAIPSTLQVLMDLEEDGEHASQLSSSSVAASGRQRQTSGFMDAASSSQVVKSVTEHEKIVLNQLTNLVNNEELSDIKIQTKEKDTVYAHKFLLCLRCPKLLQDLDESEGVCSVDIPKDVLLSILRYVYCGSVAVDGDHALQVVQYSQKYNLPELAKACQPILKMHITPHKTPRSRRKSQPEKEDGGEDGSGPGQDIELDESDLESRKDHVGDVQEELEFKNKDLNELLQSLWDDSDEESDGSSTDESGDEKDPDEEEMEEIYEFASTQAKQKKTKSVNEMDGDEHRTEDEATKSSPRQPGNDGELRQSRKDKETISDVTHMASGDISKRDSEPDKSISPMGRLTRRGWKPIATEESSQKKRMEQSTDKADNLSSQSLPQPQASFMSITDDYNEQDIDMEDVSDGIEKEVAEENIKGIRRTSLQKGSLEINGASTCSTSFQQDSTTIDRENVIDLTQKSPVSSPGTRSSSKRNLSLKPATKSSKDLKTSDEGEPVDKEDKDVTETDNDKSMDQLDESVDESDTSWIIPNTPPPKPTRSKQKPPVLQNKSADSSKSLQRQSTSLIVASTPTDVRLKGSSFGNFLPKMSPVKIVLEKMSLDASSPSVTVIRNADTETYKISDSPNLTTSKQNATSKVNGMTNSKQLTRQRSSSQIPESPSPNRSGTRSWSQTPSKRTRSSSQSKSPWHNLKSMNTKNNNSKKRPKVVSPKQTSPGSPRLSATPKSKYRRISSPPSLSKECPTASRKSRRPRVKESDFSSRRNSPPKLTPDDADISAPILVSDESPTPSPTFGRSIPMSNQAKQSQSPHDCRQAGVKPAKRKRKQSTPMRSPDKLQMTSNDAPVTVTSPGHLKYNKLKQRMAYHPLKKKYKSFSPIGREAIKRRRTRSFTKAPTVPQNNTATKTKDQFSEGLTSQNMNQHLEASSKTEDQYSEGTSSGHKDQSSNGRHLTLNEQSNRTVNGTKNGRNLSLGISTSSQPNISRTQQDDNFLCYQFDSNSSHQTDNVDTKMEDPTTSTPETERGGDPEVSIVSPDNAKGGHPANKSSGINAEDGMFAFDVDGGVKGGDPEVSIVRSTPDGSQGNKSNGGSLQEEPMFAFDVDEGGFDDYAGIHDISSGDHSYSKHDNVDTNGTGHKKVGQDNGSVLPDTNNKELEHNTRTKPETTQFTETDCHSETLPTQNRVQRSSVGISIVKKKDTLNQNYLAKHDISPSPKKQIMNLSTPVISEKVQLLRSFSPPLHNLSSREQDAVIALAQPQAAYRQQSTSPDAQDHPISPSQTFVSPSEEAGYFGIATDSFVQDDVFDTSAIRSDVVSNGNHPDDDDDNARDLTDAVFVSPVGNPQVAIVRPTPVRNIDELYHPAAPVTPMPNYDDMDTPALKKESYKYGLKALAKKKARLKLKEIYQYTHQVLETSIDKDDSSEKGSDSDTAKRKNVTKNKKDKPAKTAKTQAKNVKNGGKGRGSRKAAGGSEDPVEGKGHGSRKAAGGSEDPDEGKGQGAMNPPPTPPRKRKEMAAGEESSGDTSDAPSNADCPEDSILDDDEIPMSQPLSKNPEEAIMMYIKGKKELHQRVLMYEPFFIKEFQKELKEAGIVCSMLQLKTILDKQGITFRAEPSNRHVRKSKKQKAK